MKKIKTIVRDWNAGDFRRSAGGVVVQISYKHSRYSGDNTSLYHDVYVIGGNVRRCLTAFRRWWRQNYNTLIFIEGVYFQKIGRVNGIVQFNRHSGWVSVRGRLPYTHIEPKRDPNDPNNLLADRATGRSMDRITTEANAAKVALNRGNTQVAMRQLQRIRKEINHLMLRNARGLVRTRVI